MEFSPFGQNDEVVEFCVDNGILMLVDEPGVKNMRHSHPVLLEKSEELEISVDEVMQTVCATSLNKDSSNAPFSDVAAICCQQRNGNSCESAAVY